MQKSKERSESCARNRKSKQVYDRIRKQFLAKKWELVKVKNKEMVQIHLQEEKKRRAAKHLWKVNNMRKVVDNIFKIFKNYKFQILSKDLVISSAARIFIKCKMHFRKFAPKIEERNMRRAQWALKFQLAATQDIVTKRSEWVIILIK